MIQNPTPSRSPLISDRIIVGALLFLGLLPTAAGIYRLVELGGAAPVTAENARFHASPAPVVLHVVGSLIYSLLGAFQFAQGLRRRNLSWHRSAGRVIAIAGLVSALSGFWMTLYYPAASNDGPALYYVRLFVAPAMAFCLVMGVYAITGRNTRSHGAWMLRAYALGMGAGTQVFTHLGYMLLVATPTGYSRDAMMALGWLLNAALAEWIIWRSRR
ncbi:MAG: DUF2306 domain-containing protein [Spirochaetota bacterium]